MKQRWMHIALALLVLAQPVASASAWASMLASGLDAAVAQAEMPPCHEATPEVPDCCEDMSSAACGMDCGTASPAISQSQVLAGVPGHGAWNAGAYYASPDHPPESFFKPPRIS